MPDDINDIRDFYSRAPDYEDERLNRHQLEFEMTLKFMDEFLPSDANILELGAATGRYTVELAKRGYRGVAVDLAPTLMERCRQRLRKEGVTSWQTIVADARNLDEIGGVFDAVLIMGPLYHLVEAEDRARVLEEARDRLVDDGVCFTSWISRVGVLGDLLKNHPEWIDREDEVTSILSEGREPPGPRSGFRGYFARVDEIEPFHEKAGLNTVVLAGIEPAISADDDSYNSLEPPLRARWLDLLYRVSTEPSAVGASRHLLYIGKKS